MNPFTLVSGGVLHGDRYDLRKATMLDLIQNAYQAEPETIIGGPNWRRRCALDSHDSHFAAGSPDKPFNVVRVACENRSLLPKGCRRHYGVNDIRRPGNA